MIIKAEIRELDRNGNIVYASAKNRKERIIDTSHLAYDTEGVCRAEAAKYELSEVGHMPNYVLRRYYEVPSKEVKRWRQISKVPTINIEEIKVIRDLKLSAEEVSEITGYTAKQVEATRALYESKYTNLEDKLKYYYVEVRDHDNKLVVGGYLGKSFSWDDRNIIMKNIEKGIWQVALI